MFRRKIAKFDKQIGIWSCLSNNTVVEILSVVGFDWIVVDMEHAPNEVPQVLSQLQVIQGSFSSTEAIVRVPWNEPVVVKRVLDMGAQTLLFPYIESASEARAAVRATRYPPHGVRGVMSTARMNGYGTVRDYYLRAAGEMCVVVQCETEAAVRSIPEIAAVEGVDAVFIGPSDLSASVGKIGQFEDPQVQALIRDALRACQESNIPAGILTSNKAYAKRYLAAGFTFVGVNSDTNLLARGAEALLAEFQEAI